MAGPYYLNSATGQPPLLGGLPVAITQTDYLSCCVCDDNNTLYPGEVNLLTRFPYLTIPGGTVPYPDGIVCIGPFGVDIIVWHETDVQCYYDDVFSGGTNPCSMSSLYRAWYGPTDGSVLTDILANPLSAGDLYSVTVTSYLCCQVGIEITPAGQPGTYAKLKWSVAGP